MEILLIIGQWVLPLLASLLTILGIAGVKRLLDKMNVERSSKIDDMIDRYVRIGINTAEVSARKYMTFRQSKATSSSKKVKAISTVLAELEKSGVRDVAEELISDRIEHWLEVDGLNPGAPSDPQTGGEDA